VKFFEQYPIAQERLAVFGEENRVNQNLCE
jgi:hypothetical protein